MDPFIITISYAAFKLVFAGGASTVYFLESGADIIAVIVSAGAQPSLRCVISGADITDFDANIRPTAIEVSEINDALALVPLGITPPSP